MSKFINTINILLIFALTSSMAQQNNSIKFDGINDFVSIPDDTSLDLTNDYTLEAWVFPQKFGLKEEVDAMKRKKEVLINFWVHY